ncbi:MAG: putative pterin-4-alpha-carbinolamine dehydratase [Gammaproteobacteria bacterium]|nr:putative pterin-4-alpha-carbinolamine dehydratase [Gammaproteobacteria bacterium]
MTELTAQYCEACQVGAPRITQQEIDEFMPQIPDWKTVEIAGVQRLQRQYQCKNFARALDFANKVGELAEKEDHHPSILVEYGKVTLTWWTHKIKGLHVNDFIMAARSDQLL